MEESYMVRRRVDPNHTKMPCECRTDNPKWTGSEINIKVDMDEEIIEQGKLEQGQASCDHTKHRLEQMSSTTFMNTFSTANGEWVSCTWECGEGAVGSDPVHA